MPRFAPNARDRLLWTEPDGLPVWRVAGSLQDRASAAADQAAIAGAAAGASPAALRRAHAGAGAADRGRLATQEPVRSHLVRLDRGGHGAGSALVARRASRLAAGRRLALRQPGAVRPGATAAGAAGPAPTGRAAPAWLASAACRRSRAWLRPVRPSHMTRTRSPPRPRRSTELGDGYRRGRIVHRLLQALPGQPADRREAAPGAAAGRSGPRARCRRAARARRRDLLHSRCAAPRRPVRPELARGGAARRRDRRSAGVRPDRPPGDQRRPRF